MGANDTLEQLNAARAYAIDLEAENARLEASIAKGQTIVQRAADLAASTPFSLQEATEALTWTTDMWRRYQDAEAENRILAAEKANLEGQRDALAAVIAEAKAWCEERADYPVFLDRPIQILERADTDAALREVRAKAWDEGAETTRDAAYVEHYGRESEGVEFRDIPNPHREEAG